MNLPVQLSTSTLAALMIGDGLLALFQPKRRVALWAGRGEPVDTIPVPRHRSSFVAALGVIELAAGIWLATHRGPRVAVAAPATRSTRRKMTRRGRKPVVLDTVAAGNRGAVV